MEKAQETPTLIRQCERNQATFFLHDDSVKDPSFFQPRPSLYIIHHCASSLAAVIHPLLYHLLVP